VQRSPAAAQLQSSAAGIDGRAREHAELVGFMHVDHKDCAMKYNNWFIARKNKCGRQSNPSPAFSANCHLYLSKTHNQ
jgi:hypothetical protein